MTETVRDPPCILKITPIG